MELVTLVVHVESLNGQLQLLPYSSILLCHIEGRFVKETFDLATAPFS